MGLGLSITTPSVREGLNFNKVKVARSPGEP